MLRSSQRVCVAMQTIARSTPWSVRWLASELSGELTKHGSVPTASVSFSGQVQCFPPDEYNFVIVLIALFPRIAVAAAVAAAGGGDTRAGRATAAVAA